MTDDEIINMAITELKKSELPYKMYSDFSITKGFEKNNFSFIKIRHLLMKSGLFEKYSEDAFKFSSIGLEVSKDGIDWDHYKKSLPPKKDKWSVLKSLFNSGI